MHAATKISDNEVALEKAQKEQLNQKVALKAQSTMDLIDQLEKLVITRRSGPNGHLFGAVSVKTISEELVKAIGTDLGKVKVTLSTPNNAIKEVGDYEATIVLGSSKMAKSTKLTVAVVSDTE